MTPRRRIRPERTGVRAPLGELEMAVMRYVWACGGEGCRGAEVQRKLSEERPVALTTVLTTLERLLAKGILEREREGKAYRYRAAISEEQLQKRIVEGVLSSLVVQFPGAVANYLAENGIDGDEEALLELARRVQEASAAQRRAEGVELEDE